MAKNTWDALYDIVGDEEVEVIITLNDYDVTTPDESEPKETESKADEKKSDNPKTGAVAAVIAVTALAGAAVVITKKRS
ncbi:MAG: NPXTG-anchored protein [Ruminococcus sp.]|nr:NPXTG-anchored protein [Ruminococcus sp.]MBR6968766.1 NPXTG-anchored protein [Ruminococcus sp.]